jgi:hypothetical protein
MNATQTQIAAFGVHGSFFSLHLRSWRVSKASFPPTTNITLWIDTDPLGPLVSAHLTCNGLYVVRRKFGSQHLPLKQFQPRKGFYALGILPETNFIITVIEDKILAYQSTSEGIRLDHKFKVKDHRACCPRVGRGSVPLFVMFEQL